MANNFGVNAQTQKGLGAQDTTSLLQKMFTGRVVAGPAFPAGGMTGIVQTSTDTTCIATIDDFATPGHPTPTLTCYYEPRPGAGNPPAGTPCFISHAANGDRSPWILAFSGWPS